MNLLNYIEKYGDNSFLKLAFNELDALVFSAFSYIRFDEVFKKNTLSMNEIIAKFENISDAKRKKYYMYPDDERLLILLRDSKRYNGLSIIDKCSVFNKKATTQFFAFAVRISNDEIVVAYRGTDQTLLGWYESMKLGLDEYIGGQEKSKEFLAKLIEKHPSDKFYVCGHSKGGNYAVYAASAIKPSLQNKVQAVLNFDGPSLLQKTKDRTNYRSIKNKIVSYLPCDSVVGTLLGNDTKVVTIDSEFVGIVQHIYYFWKVCGIHFKKGKRRTIASNAFEKTFPAWLSSLSDDEMRDGLKVLFSWIKKAKINKVIDFLDFTKVNKLMRIIRSQKDPSVAKFGEQVIKFFKLYMKCVIHKVFDIDLWRIIKE